MVVRSMNHIAAVCILVAPTVWAPFIGAAAAETYPSRPLRIIVPAVAGGAADVVARSLGLKMAESWRQQVVVDNRSGIIGAELAAQAAANGYTLMLATSALIVRECVYANLNYSTLRDFAPVTQLFTQANVLVVHPALGVRSVQDLVALAKARPGQLNFGSGGTGTSNHLGGELFALLAGIQVEHVPYKGIPQAITDLLGGRVQFMFGSPVTMLPHVKDGKLRVLAVATPQRSPALPDLPTIAESGVPGYEFTGWIGMLAPRKTPKAIVAMLQQEASRIVHLPDVNKRFATDAALAVGSSSEEFTTVIKDEIARWTKVVRAANIRAE